MQSGKTPSFSRKRSGNVKTKCQAGMRMDLEIAIFAYSHLKGKYAIARLSHYPSCLQWLLSPRQYLGHKFSFHRSRS